MLKLPKELKLQLFNLIKTQDSPFGDENGQNGLLPFLELIWPLRTLPSEDGRYSDAWGDAHQHLVNNSDWDYDYTFLTRFKLLESDEYFNRFLEAVVSPGVRRSEDEMIKFILLIQPLLEKQDYVFSVDGHTTSGYPVYKLRENIDGNDFLYDLQPNTIRFFVQWSLTGRSDRRTSHSPPPEFPSFVLAYNDGWNDYSIHSLFNLYFYPTKDSGTSIGEIKIISDSEEDDLIQKLDDDFTQLNQSFCSLGQSVRFYSVLKELLGRDFESVLFALRDAAFFADNHDRFENSKRFINSLIRYDQAEQTFRTAKYVVYSYDLQNLYNFKYSFTPMYADESVELDFEFSKGGLTGNRIYAVIGKNGTGKTQLVSSIPKDISEKRDNLFIPTKIPYFSKVIAVSYSYFDRFEFPRKSKNINYVYCGLRKNENEPMTDSGLVNRFYYSWKSLVMRGRLKSWRRVIDSFIDPALIDPFIDASGTLPKIDPILFQETKKKLSSGQSIVLYVITEIITNIRFDSLLLFDEPETHLHPNAITELMHIIYQLVDEFQSYCLIATHSPVVIRELFSKNVYILEREGDVPSVRLIGIESYGEDIGVLTDEVFGNKEVLKNYKRTISEMADRGLSFEQIVSNLETGAVPLSLNTRMFIRSAVKQRNA